MDSPKVETPRRRNDRLSALELEDAFEELKRYVYAKRQEEQRILEETEEAESDDEEKKCLHEEIETEDEYTCRKCGVVLTSKFQPDALWFDHAMGERVYSDVDRLNAATKALNTFIERVELETNVPLYVLQERLRYLKIDAGFKNLNYAIVLICLLEGDVLAQQALIPFLPKSHVAWARSMRLLNPLPDIFYKNWLKVLLSKCPSRDLSKTQKKFFFERCSHFNSLEKTAMDHLILCYDYDLMLEEFEKFPFELKHALYRFTRAVQ